ncbi:MAG: hypothetical protein ABSB35_33145 [Bryobacteraceae bacterium]|jgi:hypothetical protein
MPLRAHEKDAKHQFSMDKWLEEMESVEAEVCKRSLFLIVPMRVEHCGAGYALLPRLPAQNHL